MEMAIVRPGLCNKVVKGLHLLAHVAHLSIHDPHSLLVNRFSNSLDGSIALIKGLLRLALTFKLKIRKILPPNHSASWF
jgi:hypothetical protein